MSMFNRKAQKKWLMLSSILGIEFCVTFGDYAYLGLTMRNF